MDKSILIIGSLNMDMAIRMRRMPVVGETVMGDAISYSAGGKGANQACAAGRLGKGVKMLGCVGDDELGGRLKQGLAASGVDISGLKIDPEAPTGMASIYVDSEGKNSIVVLPGANASCDIPYIESMDGALAECDYLLLQMEIPADAVYHAIRRGKELGKTVILNPAPAPECIPGEVLAMIDYLTPNETELSKLAGVLGTGLEAVREGAGRLLEKGVKNVLVTMGNQGCFFASQDRAGLYPAREVEPVDTTAAGDCFNGAFAVALAEGRTAEEAIRFANRASSITVTRKGAQDSLPAREEVEAAGSGRMEVRG